MGNNLSFTIISSANFFVPTLRKTITFPWRFSQCKIFDTQIHKNIVKIDLFKSQNFLTSVRRSDVLESAFEIEKHKNENSYCAWWRREKVGKKNLPLPPSFSFFRSFTFDRKRDKRKEYENVRILFWFWHMTTNHCYRQHNHYLTSHADAVRLFIYDSRSIYFLSITLPLTLSFWHACVCVRRVLCISALYSVEMLNCLKHCFDECSFGMVCFRMFKVRMIQCFFWFFFRCFFCGHLLFWDYK